MPPPPAKAPLHAEVLAAQKSDIFTALLLLRWTAALCVRTFFQPDEYFQAQEPAWQLLHGPASGAWMTWEWREHLRSSLHPVLFAAAYAAVEAVLALLHCVGPLRAIVLTAVPAVVQAVFAAAGDYFVWQLASQLYGQQNSTWAALWLCIVSPWQWYCGTRTFSNGLEAALTSAALAFWPWQLLTDAGKSFFARKADARQLRVCLLLAATAVVLRPTNLLIWAALLTVTVTRLTLDGVSSGLPRAVLLRLAVEIAACGSTILAVSAVSDRLFYGAWTFPLLIFLDVNVTRDIAVFYGHNPWHYYLSQGLPLLTMASLPFAVVGTFHGLFSLSSPSSSPSALLTSNARRALAFVVVSTVTAMSLIAHKEVRFLYPLLPILQVLAAPHVASFFWTAPSSTSPSTSVSTPVSTSVSTSAATSQSTSKQPLLQRKRLLSFALLLQAIIAGYLSLFHQPAPLSVLSFLRHEYERIHHDCLEGPLLATATPASPELFALFLTPCHSTPWRSHLVYPGLHARALTCEPPLDTPPRSAARAAYLDEADRFYAAFAQDTPAARHAFLASEMWPADKENTDVPRYIVGFEGIEDHLTEYFASSDPATGGSHLGVSLHRVWSGWNGFFNEDWRRSGRLVVWDTGVFSNASHPDAL